MKRTLHTNGKNGANAQKSWMYPTVAITTGVVGAYLAFGQTTVQAEAKSLLPNKKGTSATLEDAKDLNGWAEPGVYLWGDNR